MTLLDFERGQIPFVDQEEGCVYFTFLHIPCTSHLCRFCVCAFWVLSPSLLDSRPRDKTCCLLMLASGCGCCCSAGVGRTGTFIALDFLMQFVNDHSLDDEVDIHDLVLNMRHNRPHMVHSVVCGPCVCVYVCVGGVCGVVCVSCVLCVCYVCERGGGAVLYV